MKLQVDATDKVWKALSDATRRAILDELADGPATTGELVEQFANLSRTAVMKHLDVLFDAELILIRRDGRVRWNYINPVPIQLIYDRWIRGHVRGLSRSLAKLKVTAENEKTSIKRISEKEPNCRPARIGRRK